MMYAKGKNKLLLLLLLLLLRMSLTHPVGRSLTSDWFRNSFIMVVYKNLF